MPAAGSLCHSNSLVAALMMTLSVRSQLFAVTGEYSPDSTRLASPSNHFSTSWRRIVSMKNSPNAGRRWTFITLNQTSLDFIDLIFRFRIFRSKSETT